MAVKAAGKASPKQLESKIASLEKRIEGLRKQQSSMEGEVKDSVKASEGTEKDMESLEKDMSKVSRDIDRIEQNFDRMSSFLLINRIPIGRAHFFELGRGVAGAFLGVGVGMGIRFVPGIAEGLEWNHALAIMAFIMVIGAVLIYKNEKEWIAKEGKIFVPKRLIHLLLISFAVEAVALYMFNMIPHDPYLILKSLIVGSYPAMSGAVTFTITS
jgi:uncharacterized membrane protein